MPRALVALAIGAFAIGSTEFVVIGLLPQIADGLDVTVPAMGLLITAYAIGVMIGAPTLTALSARLTTRQTLISLMGVFIVGNTMSALAPSYTVLMIARVVTALAHGSFFGVGAIAARRAVAPEKATQAISLMFLGLTISNVIGVPGRHLPGPAVRLAGDLRRHRPDRRRHRVRPAGLASGRRHPDGSARRDRLVPPQAGLARPRHHHHRLRVAVRGLQLHQPDHESAGRRQRERHHGGAGAVRTRHHRRRDRRRAGSATDSVCRPSPSDWPPSPGCWPLFTVTSHNPISATITLVLFGAVAFSLGPIVQNRIIVAAGTGGSLVSAANQGAFNVANAIGAAGGAYVIKVGFGLTGTMWVGAILAAAGARDGAVRGGHGSPAGRAGRRPRRAAGADQLLRAAGRASAGPAAGSAPTGDRPGARGGVPHDQLRVAAGPPGRGRLGDPHVVEQHAARRSGPARAPAGRSWSGRTGRTCRGCRPRSPTGLPERGCRGVGPRRARPWRPRRRRRRRRSACDPGVPPASSQSLSRAPRAGLDGESGHPDQRRIDRDPVLAQRLFVAALAIGGHREAVVVVRVLAEESDASVTQARSDGRSPA